MTPTSLFYLLIAIIVIVFLIDSLLDILNARHYNDKIPEELSDVYPQKEYEDSIAYKRANYKFKLLCEDTDNDDTIPDVVPVATATMRNAATGSNLIKSFADFLWMWYNNKEQWAEFVVGTR